MATTKSRFEIVSSQMFVSAPTLTETLEFVMKGLTLPFGMVRDIAGCFQHKLHEFPHIKRIVGKLRVVPEAGMVTLKKVSE